MLGESVGPGCSEIEEAAPKEHGRLRIESNQYCQIDLEISQHNHTKSINCFEKRDVFCV